MDIDSIKNLLVNYDIDYNKIIEKVKYESMWNELIFKKYNALVKIGQNDFTNRKNTLGGIYIVRDPRNVLDSMSRHFQINRNKALSVMQNENNYIYDFKKKNDSLVVYDFGCCFESDDEKLPEIIDFTFHNILKKRNLTYSFEDCINYQVEYHVGKENLYKYGYPFFSFSEVNQKLKASIILTASTCVFPIGISYILI